MTRSPGPVLAYYDPKKSVTLQVDASKYGLSIVLLQDSRPVAYASKTLTSSEINYAQIEKEMLAILFGCKRFHQYVYGRRFTVETDHSPLIFIMKKPLAAAPARLQRMLLQLHRYDIDIVHKACKDIPVADALSRKFLSDTYPELSDSMDALVHSVMSSIPINDTRLDETRAIMSADPQSLKLKLTIMNGWPDNQRDCSPSVKEFWNFGDELSVANDLIVKGNRIFVPKGQRQTMLERIHTGHMGVTKCT